MDEQKESLLENKLIVNHLNNLENKGLIKIVKPVESHWWENTRSNGFSGNTYEISNTIIYRVYPVVEPFDLNTWDLTNPTCMSIYLNWYNDFLKTLKPEGIAFKDNNNASRASISIHEFNKDIRTKSIFVGFGNLCLSEVTGTILDYGFRILKLDDINDESTIIVSKEKMILNKLIPFEKRVAGEIVRDTYILLLPSKQYTLPLPGKNYLPNGFETPLKEE